MAPRNDNDEFTREYLKITLDAVENLKSKVQELAIEVAVVKTKVATIAVISGFMSSLATALIVKLVMR